MTYIEKLQQMMKDGYTFNDDSTWYVTDRQSICYCSSNDQCYHYKIMSKIFTDDRKCSFTDRFKPNDCIRFSNIERELFRTI